MTTFLPRSPFPVLRGLAWFIALAACATAPARAQGTPGPGAPAWNSVGTATGEAIDPPGRVGRLAEITGQVWLYHPGGGEWIGAERNRPLTTGDRLATDAGARAELRVGSTTLRLDAGSELEVLRLDDDRIDLKLHSGSLAARLRSRETVPEFALETGEGRFTVQRTGRYRFDRSDETSHATVYSGQALYEGQGSALTIDSGQRAEFWLDRANAAQYSITEPVRDAFAGWSAERDRVDDRSASARYVSPEMTGVEDLDRHGRWEETAEYGAVWYPRVVASGWAPYSAGRWAWVQPWGWTWVDDASWGFAPFHYGRWVYVRNHWGWAPGQYVRRPVYAPALVAWVGGPRLSVSINLGGGPAVGWLPLAPREVYVPTYRVTPRYVREVNVSHLTRISNIGTIVDDPQAALQQRDFSNRKFPHALTVVPASVLASRQPVAPEAARWRNAPGVRDLVNQPSRMSAVVAPAVIAPPLQPAPPRGQPMPPRGRWSSVAPRVEGPAASRRAEAPAAAATPVEPERQALPARVAPPPRGEPPTRSRFAPGVAGVEAQRQVQAPPLLQAQPPAQPPPRQPAPSTSPAVQARPQPPMHAQPPPQLERRGRQPEGAAPEREARRVDRAPRERSMAN